MTKYHHIIFLIALGIAMHVSAWSQNQRKEKDQIGSQDIQIYKRGRPEGSVLNWAIGPFSIGKHAGENMIFRQKLNWKDPAAPESWKQYIYIPRP